MMTTRRPPVLHVTFVQSMDDVTKTPANTWKLIQTSRTAVAERPRDASCLSVASIVQYIERNFRFRFTAAYK